MNRWSAFVQAARDSQRPVVALLLEALRLRCGIGRLGLSDYLDFRLYLNDLSFADKTAFAGWRMQAILEDILVDGNSRFLSLDKVTMYALLQGCGFPIPVCRAVFRSQRPAPISNLASADALAAYLKVPDHLPVYLKRSYGAYGRGNTLVRSLEQGMLVLGDGSRVTPEHLSHSLDDGHTLGWILQEPLVPHSQIAALCGDKISGLRIHTFLTPTGPEILKAIFKINMGARDSDNFEHGASGNLLAALDSETGRVTRIVSGTGAQQVVLSSHPKTGHALLGFQLPFWEETRQLVLDAQRAFPGYLCPGWDIAICEQGPKILEVNFFGDVDLPQHAYRQGFLDAHFMRLMEARGLAGLLSTGPKRRLKSKRNGRLGIRSHHWPW